MVLEAWLGVPSLLATLGCTVAVMGFAAFMTGQALAATWRPAWHLGPYALLLGMADRFLIWGLLGGDGLSVSGYLIDTGFLALVGFGAYRATRRRKMVSQYPWLYASTGLFTWARRADADVASGRPGKIVDGDGNRME